MARSAARLLRDAASLRGLLQRGVRNAEPARYLALRGHALRRRGDVRRHVRLHQFSEAASAQWKGYGPSGSCIQAGMSRCACSTRQTSRWSSRST